MHEKVGEPRFKIIEGRMKGSKGYLYSQKQRQADIVYSIEKINVQSSSQSVIRLHHDL